MGAPGIDIRSLFKSDEQWTRYCRDRVLSWFAMRECLLGSLDLDDQYKAWMLLKIAQWRGYNPIRELRALGYEESELQALLRRSQLDEEAFTATTPSSGLKPAVEEA